MNEIAKINASLEEYTDLRARYNSMVKSVLEAREGRSLSKAFYHRINEETAQSFVTLFSSAATVLGSLESASHAALTRIAELKRRRLPEGALDDIPVLRKRQRGRPRKEQPALPAVASSPLPSSTGLAFSSGSTFSSASSSSFTSSSVSPSHYTGHSRRDDPLDGKLPVSDAPYPPLCGAMPAGSQPILPNSYVAYRSESGDILATVVRVGPDVGKYMVMDADPDQPESEKRKLVVHRDLLTPLPTSIPARWTPPTFFKKGSRVRALFPETTAFYNAVVEHSPANTKDAVYHVIFEDDEDHDGNPIIRPIPPRFVIATTTVARDSMQ